MFNLKTLAVLLLNIFIFESICSDIKSSLVDEIKLNLILLTHASYSEIISKSSFLRQPSLINRFCTNLFMSMGKNLNKTHTTVLLKFQYSDERKKENIELNSDSLSALNIKSDFVWFGNFAWFYLRIHNITLVQFDWMIIVIPDRWMYYYFDALCTKEYIWDSLEKWKPFFASSFDEDLEHYWKWVASFKKSCYKKLTRVFNNNMVQIVAKELKNENDYSENACKELFKKHYSQIFHPHYYICSNFLAKSTSYIQGNILKCSSTTALTSTPSICSRSLFQSLLQKNINIHTNTKAKFMHKKLQDEVSKNPQMMIDAIVDLSMRYTQTIIRMLFLPPEFTEWINLNSN